MEIWMQIVAAFLALFFTKPIHQNSDQDSKLPKENISIEKPTQEPKVSNAHFAYVKSDEASGNSYVVISGENAKAIYSLLSDELTVDSEIKDLVTKVGYGISCSMFKSSEKPSYACSQVMSSNGELLQTTEYSAVEIEDQDDDPKDNEVYSVEFKGAPAKILFELMDNDLEDQLTSDTEILNEKRGYSMTCQRKLNIATSIVTYFCHEYISSDGEVYPGSADALIRVGGTCRVDENLGFGLDLGIPEVGVSRLGLSTIFAETRD